VNTGKYLAYVMNAAYQANPNIVDLSKKFTLDKSVITAEVNQNTGEKQGKVKVDGSEVEVPGDKVKTLWAKNGPESSTYKFGIGGTDDNYKVAWKKILGN